MSITIIEFTSSVVFNYYMSIYANLMLILTPIFGALTLLKR